MGYFSFLYSSKSLSTVYEYLYSIIPSKVFRFNFILYSMSVISDFSE